MYASVRRWKADEKRIEEVKTKVEKGFIGELRKVDGFVAYYLVVADGGKATTVSVFQDRNGAQESTRLARAFAERELKGIIQGPPEIFEGEVAVHADGASASQRGAMTAGAR